MANTTVMVLDPSGKVHRPATAADTLVDGLGVTVVAGSATSAGYALLSAADAAAQRTALGLGTAATQNSGAFEAAGAIAAHEAAGDPHPGYLTPAEANAAYQPLDAQLTDLAALTYASNGLKVVRVNAGATAFELATPGGSVSLSSVAVAFTDGDTARRVTVTDAAVSAASPILLSVLRPTQTVENDPGYVYTANVVSRGTGTFDVNLVCLDWSGGDCTERPPNETVTLIYTVG